MIDSEVENFSNENPFSDGVGDGQLDVVREYEIPQMRKACKLLDENYNPGFTFIVVQKRINARFFAVSFRIFDSAFQLTNFLLATVQWQPS